MLTVRAAVCPYTMYAVAPQCTHTYSGANEALGDRTCLETFLCLLDSVYVYLCMKLRIIQILYVQGISQGLIHHTHLPRLCSSCFRPLLSLRLPITRVSEARGVIRTFLSGEKNISCFFYIKTPLLLLHAASLLMYMQVK